MSWLSDRVETSELPFAELMPSSAPFEDTGLYVLELPALLQLIRPSTPSLSVDPLRDLGAFAMVEDAQQADNRLRAARRALGGPVGPFTLAIRDAWETATVYLPDDLRAPPDTLSLFAIVDKRLRRVRAYGQFDQESAIVLDVEVLESPPCPEGPCVEWDAGCGGDCTCAMFDVESISGRVQGLRCQ